MKDNLKLTTSENTFKLKARILGDYWTLLVLKTLLNKPLRYKDLKINLEKENDEVISSRTLSQRLDYLESNQILKRTVSYKTYPSSVIYSLKISKLQVEKLVYIIEEIII